MARIVRHLPVGELEARYRAAQDATTARHYQAIWLLAQGRTVAWCMDRPVGAEKLSGVGGRPLS